ALPRADPAASDPKGARAPDRRAPSSRRAAGRDRGADRHARAHHRSLSGRLPARTGARLDRVAARSLAQRDRPVPAPRRAATQRLISIQPSPTYTKDRRPTRLEFGREPAHGDRPCCWYFAIPIPTWCSPSLRSSAVTIRSASAAAICSRPASTRSSARQTGVDGVQQSWTELTEVDEHGRRPRAVNSFGRMDGGIDLHYRNQLGLELERRLRELIEKRYEDGELPVGEALVVPTGHA